MNNHIEGTEDIMH